MRQFIRQNTKIYKIDEPEDEVFSSSSEIISFLPPAEPPQQTVVKPVILPQNQEKKKPSQDPSRKEIWQSRQRAKERAALANYMSIRFMQRLIDDPLCRNVTINDEDQQTLELYNGEYKKPKSIKKKPHLVPSVVSKLLKKRPETSVSLSNFQVISSKV